MTTIAPPSLIWYEWTDILGQTYRPGDYVIYAGLSGRHADLTVGKVDKINRYRANGQEILGPGRWDTSVKPSVFVPGPPSATVRVVPLRKKSDGKWTENRLAYNNVTRQYEELNVPQSFKTFLKVENVIKIEWDPNEES